MKLKKFFLFFIFGLALIGFLIGGSISEALLIFLMYFIISFIKKKSAVNTSQVTQTSTNSLIKCPGCGEMLNSTDKFCPKCKTPIEGNVINEVKKNVVTIDNYDSIYKLDEKAMLEEFINRALIKANIDKNTNLIPIKIRNKKFILHSIFSILLFIYISLIFFHFPAYVYVIGAVILIIIFILSINYNFMAYIRKEVLSRPEENINNIVMNIKTTLVQNSSLAVALTTIFLAIILPFTFFMKPKIFYEKVSDGYAVRFYAYGVTNFKTVTIPETHNGKKVVSLRGNAFSNMKFLEKVYLPDTITEIRGQAFKNDINLIDVKLPKNLKYLGGGAFYNCKSLKNITIPENVNEIGGEVFYNATNLTEIIIPDSVTVLGGDAFKNATSLYTVKLSNNLSAIRGGTFENCYSLKNITIPDSVTEIGGGAFYNATSLSKIIIPDSVTEIGGEAFYNAKSLKTVKLPKNLSEIRGNTFENCSSLEYIDIPDTVVRIGGHAFYGCYSLSNVYISENSLLNEIGSSAFRMCPSLNSIKIPYGTFVNERAFKESPTSISYYN